MQPSSVAPDRVSVIMPARNAAPFIDAALRSVRDQSVSDLEILVIDDGSSDATPQIVERHAREDDRVRLLRGAGRGPAAARNIGLSQAQGAWAAVVDADDLILPDRMRLLLDAARVSKAQVVADNLTAFYDDGSKPDHLWLDGPLWEHPRRLHLATFLSSDDGGGDAGLGYLKPVFRLDWLRRHDLRYDETLTIGEDFDLVSRALTAGATYVFAPFAGYRYRRRSGSISHRFSAAQLDAMIAAAQRLAVDLDGVARLNMDARIARMEEDRRFVVLAGRLKSGDVSAMAELATSREQRVRFGQAAVEGLTRRLRSLRSPS
jgi:succinoglycan biosynthesis protein ExoO